jgi:hypothetical protein
VREVRLRVIKPEPAGLDAAEESVEVRLSRGTNSWHGTVREAWRRI